MPEVSDRKFKEEMLRMMETVIVKIDDNSKEINRLKNDIHKNTKEFESLKKKFEFNPREAADFAFRDESDDLVFGFIKMLNRLSEIKRRLRKLNKKMPDIESELEMIASQVHEIYDNREEKAEAKRRMNELDLQVEKLEHAIFTT